MIGILLATLVASLLIYFFVFRKNSPLTLSRAKVVPTAQPPDKALEPEAPHQETKNKGLQSQPEILSTASYESSEYTDSSDSGSSYTSTSDDDEPPVPVLATLAPHPSIRRPPQAAAPTPDPRGIMDNSRTPQMPPQGKAPFDRAATAVHLNSMRLSEMEQRRQREIAQRAEEANRRGPGQNVAFAADRRQASFTLGRAPMRLSEASYGGHPAMLGMEGLPRPNSWFGPVAPASSASMLPSPSIISDYQPNGPSTFADAYNLPSLTSNFGAGYGAPQPTHAGFGYGHGVPPPGPNLGHTYLQMDDLSSPGIVDMYGEERAPVIEAPIVLAGPSLHAASTAPSVASLSYSPMHMAQAMKDYVFGGTHDRFSPEYSVARYATPSVQSEQFR